MLKIANWNLERVEPSLGRCSAIRRHMANVDADVWILTETHDQVAPGDDYSATFSGEPDRQSKPGERWVGIWSRLPVQPLPSFASDSARCAAARLVHPTHGDIVVYGCVLPWHGSTWRGIPSLGGAAFAVALDLQRADWRRLRNAFPNASLIVAGDFNQDLAARHYYGSRKNRRLLEDTLEEAELEVVTAAGNDPVARDSAPYACIDHICVSRSSQWRLLSTKRWPDSSMPEKRLSDHFGIVVELGQNQ